MAIRMREKRAMASDPSRPGKALEARRQRLRAARSWLFVPGADEQAHAAARDGAADVAILELEDFTAPAERPGVRRIAPALFAAWRAAGKLATIRINPLDGPDAAAGWADLDAAFADPGPHGEGAPDVILMPKVARPDQVSALARAVARAEHGAGLPVGGIPLVPNVEGAAGLLAARRIAAAHRNVLGALVASEDMAADLGAERGQDGAELAHARAHFHTACRAAGILSIDCPFTWRDAGGLAEETRTARRLGYTAKSAVLADHCPVINAILTPAADEIARARAQVDGFEAARAEGKGVVEVDGVIVELPIYLNAKRVLARAAALGVS